MADENPNSGLATVQPPPSVNEFANFSHQKGNVRMVTTTTDKIEACLSASNSLWANFFSLMIGIAAAILIALKSGGVEESSRPLFWLAFYGSMIFAAFFGVGTIFGELKKRRLRRELIRDSDIEQR
jgi:hypothetical protein